MRIKFALPFLILFVLACNALDGRPTATVPPQVEAPTLLPTAQTEAATAFRDDFEGSLDSGWQWLREDAAEWSLTDAPGFVQITAGPGHVNAEGNSNLLVRSAPPGDFQIETGLLFLPVANFQFAGLIVYESPQNFIQAGRAFCTGTDVCPGDGFYMDTYFGGTFVPPNFAAAFTDAVPVYLRVTREGNSYTFETSTDGIGWNLRGTSMSGMIPNRIGLVAGQSTAGTVPARFDYFQVTSTP